MKYNIWNSRLTISTLKYCITVWKLEMCASCLADMSSKICSWAYTLHGVRVILVFAITKPSADSDRTFFIMKIIDMLSEMSAKMVWKNELTNRKSYVWKKLINCKFWKEFWFIKKIIFETNHTNLHTWNNRFVDKNERSGAQQDLVLMSILVWELKKIIFSQDTLRITSFFISQTMLRLCIENREHARNCTFSWHMRTHVGFGMSFACLRFFIFFSCFLFMWLAVGTFSEKQNK